MLYIFDNISDFTDELYNNYISFLPPERLARAERYMHMADKKECVIAYLLFRIGILSEYGIHEAPAFCYGIYGKPYLTEYPHIHINLSHCRQGIACAISSCEVGVDIQDWILSDQRLLTRVCSNKEIDMVNKSQEKHKLFTTFWALKEAYIKNLGVGLSFSIKNCDFSFVEMDMFGKFGKMFSLQYTESYCLAVCNNDKFIQTKYISTHEFEQLL
ncbi:MAG: 4'-phosphopantetheinyl transferase superfamily protein [Anaerocolumna sp.]